MAVCSDTFEDMVLFLTDCHRGSLPKVESMKDENDHCFGRQPSVEVESYSTLVPSIIAIVLSPVSVERIQNVST